MATKFEQGIQKDFSSKNVAASQFRNSDYVRFHRFPYQPISKDRELPFWSNSLFLDLYSIPPNYKQHHDYFNSHINAMFCDGTDWGYLYFDFEYSTLIILLWASKEALAV